MKLSQIIKKLYISLTIVGLVLTMNSTSTFAKAYVYAFHLIDSGKHMDIDGSSKYMSYIWYAKDKWNDYKSGVIRKDSLFVIEDVKIRDVNTVNNKLATTSYLNHKINMNKYNLSKASANAIRSTAMHEVGHALGLNHSTSADLMYEYMKNPPKITLSQNDKDSYSASLARVK